MCLVLLRGRHVDQDNSQKRVSKVNIRGKLEWLAYGTTWAKLKEETMIAICSQCHVAVRER